MTNTFLRLVAEQPSCLEGIRRGVERECLRMTPTGYLAETPHPRALGSPLTNPYITTDFSEAMLELVTPPLSSIDEVLEWLTDIHQFVSRRIGDELLWPASMPCILRGEDSVPIARYGRSNKAQFKERYRQGLKERYGSLMQSIAGIHFNVSLPDCLWRLWATWAGHQEELAQTKSRGYFHIIRNFLRLGWLIPYLFGASPALCKTYLLGKADHGLLEWDDDTAYLPFATSLRMSDLGYKSIAQNDLEVSFANVERYVHDLLAATECQSPLFADIPAERQLNDSILQIENEFYCPIRPKRISRDELRPALALLHHGVEYVEVRSLDIDPFEPTGVGRDQLMFIEALLVYCLVIESPPFEGAERDEAAANMRAIIYEGRRPELRLDRRGRKLTLHGWADDVFCGMRPICQLLDSVNVNHDYSQGLARQWERVHYPSRTPSAQVLAGMEERKHSFFHVAMRQTVDFERYFKHRQLNEERQALLVEAAAQSLVRQEREEELDNGTFAQFCADYFSQTGPAG